MYLCVTAGTDSHWAFSNALGSCERLGSGGKGEKSLKE